ncbi:MAG: ATP-binding protein [Saprospiraceae bacterium]
MKEHFSHIFLFFVWLVFSSYVHAQTDYTFELITINERANFGDVHTLYQDSAGVIWMGIYGKGLAYYNGKEIHRMQLPGEGDFSQHNDVFVAGGGFIFLNYGHEIKSFDPIKQELVRSIDLPETLRNKGKISTIAVTEKKDELLVWATLELNNNTSDNKRDYHLLISKNGEPFQQLSETGYSTFGEPTIKNIGHNILLKTKIGLLQLNESGGKVKSYPLSEDDVAGINTFNLTVDEKQDIWFYSNCGTSRYDVIYIDHFCDINQWEKEKNIPNKFSVNRLVYYNLIKPITKNQQVGATSKIGQSFFLENTRLFNLTNHSVDTINSISIHDKGESAGINSMGQIFAMLEDETGVVWMGGSYGLGKIVPQPNAFKLLPPISLRSFVEDDNGLIYGSVDWTRTSSDEKYTERNLRVYDPVSNQVENLPKNDSYIYQNWHQAIFYKNNIYYDNCIIDLNTKETTVYKLERQLQNKNLMLLDNKERIWMTSWGESRINIYRPGESKLIKQITIPALAEKPVEINDWYQRPTDGKVWMGTYGQGIFIFTEEGDLSIQLHTSEDSPIILNSNIVSGFYEDSRGRMWIGHGKGLSCISADLSKIEHFYIDLKQPELRLVYSILPEDDDRYLWLSTSKGIFRFDSETGDFFDFPLHPIIMDMEYNRNAFYKAKSGQLFFGGAKSTMPTVAFYPEEAMSYYENIELSKANIVLDHFSKFDGDEEKIIATINGLQALDEIVLNPGDRYFSLEFFATDYRSPKDNYYSYFLDNYEKNWNEPARNNNKVRYENLPPGKYTLKMRGALMRKNLALNERSIKIIVLPYWYQTWWSKVLLGLLTIAAFYLFYRRKMTRQFELQEAVRMRDLDDLKTRLYTNITHEFRTPLTVIMGMNDNIKGHEQEKKLIKRNAKNLLRLINQLLDLSKLDSGTLKIDAVQGDIISYLHYLTESFYSMASDKKVSLNFRSETNSLIMDFDEVKIQHVVYNLLSNAIKFTRPGGKVALESNEATKDGRPYLKIKIKDTGIGIPEKDLPHIFDRFYQVEKKPSRVNTSSTNTIKTFDGTGIGLALTKELIELMGGDISVKSEEDWGTEFRVMLPIKHGFFTPKLDTSFGMENLDVEPTPDFESLPVKPDQINGEKPQVLIVEDNAGVVTYIKSLLENDYFVQVAINGQEGIDMALEHIPDLIITDVMMPEKNGYEVCSFLKKDERTSHIPIVMLTAKADVTSKIEGLEMGADAYLSKPFEKEELLVRLRKLLELRKVLQKRYASQQSTVGSLQSDDVVAHIGETIEDKFLGKLKSVIEDRLSDAEMSIPELCRVMHLSHTQLYRKLKALTDKTPSQFVRTVRLQKARELLKSSELNISEIAYEVGFSDPNYFTRMFKQEFGQVPGEVKR